MIPLQLINLATRYELPSGATIEQRNEGQWCIKQEGMVLDRGAQWVWEPQPSSRSEEFISATRFSLNEAYERAKASGLMESGAIEAPFAFVGVSAFGFKADYGRDIEVVARPDGKWAVRQGMADYNTRGEWEIRVQTQNPAFQERTGYTWEHAMTLAAGLSPKRR